MQDQQTPAIEQQEQTTRLPYERPEVIDYGSVRELTRGTGSKPNFDMMSGTRRLL